MTKENIALFFHKALDKKVRDWKKGKLSQTKYDKFIAKAYEKLKGLGLTDQEAKEILKGIEEKTA